MTNQPKNNLLIVQQGSSQAGFQQAILQTISKEKKGQLYREVLGFVEGEKCKLGNELHDGVNPLLAAAKLHLSLINPANTPEREAKNIVSSILNDTIAIIRKISSGLVSYRSEMVSLRVLINDFVAKISVSNAPCISIDYKGEQVIEDLPYQHKITIFRICQEQLNNILKYSKAGNVSISVAGNKRSIRFTIKDNGIGFLQKEKAEGIGFANMKWRVKQLNGTVDIKSSPGRGCIVEGLLPL